MKRWSASTTNGGVKLKGERDDGAVQCERQGSIRGALVPSAGFDVPERTFETVSIFKNLQPHESSSSRDDSTGTRDACATRTRHVLTPHITLDARRAACIQSERTLVVADLHLGYAWAHRHAGNLLPLTAPEDTTARLLELVEDYAPRELVLLGDIVHRALPLAAIKEQLCALFAALTSRTSLRLVAGNHDRHLAAVLRDCGIDTPLASEHRAGPHLLLHGDASDEITAAAQLAAAQSRGGTIFIGHEHPAISLGDRVATSVKCPCFLASQSLVILPAFSKWAAGTDHRTCPFMSPLPRLAPPTHAIPILAGKLLSIPFLPAKT